MMKQLRSRKTMRRILQVTLFLVIPSFVVFYGWGGKSNRGASNAQSSVFGSIKSVSGIGRTELTTQDWIRAKQSLVQEVARQLQQQGQRPNANQIEQAISTKRIADQAVDYYALKKVARDQDFQVTQGELEQAVNASFPGRTAQQIQQIVRDNLKMDMRAFANDLRERQVLGKAQLYIQSAAHVTLPDLWREYQARETQVELAYAEVPVMNRTGSTAVPDEEIKAEYEARKESLEIPDRAIYDYVVVTREDVRKTIEPTDEELQEYYEKVKEERFRKPGEAKIRHVLIRVPQGASAEQAQAARQRIDEVYAKAQSGTPLGDLADQYTDDPRNTEPASEESTETVKLHGIPPQPVVSNQVPLWGQEFVNQVFSIPVDTLSSPVLTNLGWDLFEVLERTPPTYTPFEDAKLGVSSLFRQDKINELMQGKLQEFETARRNQTTLEGIARALKTDVRETSPVVVGTDRIPPLGFVREYVTEIKELEPGGEPTYVIETSNKDYAVLQMKELMPRHLPTLDEVRVTLFNDIKSRTALEEAIADARTIVARVNNGDVLTSVALEMSYNHGKTDQPFALRSARPPYSQMKDLGAWVLLTPEGKTFVTEGYVFGDGPPRSLFVCEVIEKIAPDREAFLNELPQMKMQSLVESQMVLVNGYFQDARRQLAPEYNPDVVTSSQ